MTNTHRSIRFIQKWSAQNIFYHDKKDNIGRLAEETCGATPGSREYIGALQTATTHFWKELSAEEEEKYVEMAKDWLENAPLNHIQARQVTPTILCTR
jgi:hypothetical protein